MKLEKMEFDSLNLIFVQNNKDNKNEVHPSNFATVVAAKPISAQLPIEEQNC
jgi:hypothetical protein